MCVTAESTVFCAATTEPTASGAEVQANLEVVKKLKALETCFACMLTSIMQCYANCNPAIIRFFLYALLGTEEFKNCSTIDEILRQLRQGHTDTFNTYYLEQLAVQFQRDEVNKLIDEYNKKTKAFLTETVVTEL